jgi:cell division protein FtsI (penicillin-binding protein 3)
MTDDLAVLRRRVVIGAAFSVAAFAAVGARLVDVTLFPSAAIPVRAVKPAAVAFASRGDLVDRNGDLLARNLRVYDLYAQPKKFADPAKAARLLAAVAGGDEARLNRVFAGTRQNVLVARQLAPEVRDRTVALGLPGLDFQPVGKRSYSEGRISAQVLGITDGGGKGISGLERGLDKRLEAAGAGGRVQTSLDSRVQYVLANEAAAGMKAFSAKAAGALVMDVNTGEVLGLVSLPDFDPNERATMTDASRRNIMAQDVYELGSVFKIFAFAQGIETHSFSLGESFAIGNGFKIGKYTVHEAERMPARLAARDVLAQSSNIGTAQIALRGGADRQRAFLARMGLLDALRTELPETASPLVPRNWGTVETATIAFGHGLSVSPLSYAAAAAAIVNGGRKVTPTFLKTNADGRGEQLISPATSGTMRMLLRYVVTDGTGKKADVPGYEVGGKTGSAEKPGRGGYLKHKLMTSFLAVFPVSSPRYLVFVLLDEPKGNASTSGFALAGYTAAPLVGQIISRIAPLLGVPMSPTANG